MKKLYLFICLSLVFSSIYFQAYSQDVNNRKLNANQPVFFTPKSHNPNFLKSGKLSDKSFYQRKSEWKHIIDSTWGPGDSLSRKLLIFNTYAKAIYDKFDGFNSKKISYDSLYNRYLSQINDSTSKGAFSSIMTHFAYDLRDFHTWAGDTTVTNTPLNPGVPLLLIGSFLAVEHFGAVTTVLPDSTTLVLRVALNHPLNLEPGDIILGYEGIAWKDLVKELFKAGLPLMVSAGGCKTANKYHNLMGVGLNWHLFSTIDILKYSSGDTLHLSVLPLLNLELQKMRNNEQLSIPNIPFPQIKVDYPAVPDTVVTYGILKNTNIGYIYLAMEHSEGNADFQFYNAINALKNADALIIDMRLNLGGWALFDKAFNILFNEFHKTIEDSYRCSTNTFELCPFRNWSTYQINGLVPDCYDRPIAVLLGPTCVSMGDITAQRLRYHPMVRFFGTSSAATFGDNLSIKDFKNWELHYSIGDMFHVNTPGDYLNGKEFPIDYPIWFNKDDVAKGKDPIVEKSLEWINNLAFGHDLSINKGLILPANDTTRITATIENPNSHELSAKLIFDNPDGYVVDSTEMTQINIPNGNNWQGTQEMKGLLENNYWVSLKVTDHTEGTSFTNKHMTKITNKPLEIGRLSYFETSSNKYSIKTELKNSGKSMNIVDLTVKLTSNNPWIKSITPDQVILNGLKPGETKRIPSFTALIDETTFPGYLNLTYTISEAGWPLWKIDTTLAIVPTGIKPEQSLPLANFLDQNYPNPVNSTTTTVSWQLAHVSRATLKIFDLVGLEVATLVDEQRPAGKYETEFNVATIPKGVYFYQLKAGDFIQTRKMIVMK